MAWTDLTSSDIGSGAPVTPELWAKFKNNDEAATEHLFQLVFPQINLSNAVYPAWQTGYQCEVWVPPTARYLRVTLYAWRQAGTGTAYLRGLIAGAAASDVLTFTSGTPDRVTLTWSNNLTAYRASRRTLELQGAGTTLATYPGVDSTDIIACRWSYL